MKADSALVRTILRLYPRDFRERFGDSMRQALRDRVRAARGRGRIPAGLTYARGCLDLAGNGALLRFQARARARMNWQSLALDVRYAVRLLGRSPLFSFLGIVALALGIGANTAIFTVVHSVLLKALPYSDPDRLVMVWSTNAAEHRDRDAVAPLDLLDYRKANAFSALEATYSFVVGGALTNASGAAEQIIVTAVTPGTFEMLGRAPEVGRFFTPEEAQTAVVVSDAFWRTRLGRGSEVIGHVLTIFGQPRTIVGVMPPDFVFPYRAMLGPSGFTRRIDVEAWLPLRLVPGNSVQTGDASLTRAARFLSVIGRLRPGMTAAQASAELSAIASQLSVAHPDTNRAVGATVVGLHEQAVGAVRPALLILLGGVGFVLLMACVNLASMLLARSVSRQREMAIRSALGAGRSRLMAQTLIETTLLALAGGVVAVAAVRWGIGLLVAAAPPDMPRLGEVHADVVVFAFTLALSVATGLAIGILPAISGSRPQLQAVLKGSARGATAGRGQRRLRSVLVVSEVALALVLTLGAGLLLRSFLSVLSVDPGFKADHLLTLQMTVPGHYQTADQQRALYASVFAKLGALPRVIATGGTTRLPLGSTNVTTKVAVEGTTLPVGQWPEVEFRRAMHDYFAAMGIPVLRGRGFAATDGPNAPRVVVVNQTMARQLFGPEDPVGRRLTVGTPGAQAVTIVGVIGDVRHSALESPPSPEIYTYYLQSPPVNPFLVIRTANDPSVLAALVRRDLQAIDKEISVYDIRSMDQVRSDAVSQRRFLVVLVGAFGTLALIMAAVGVYGVMALLVTERTQEIGIRLALGAKPSIVARHVIGHGMLLAMLGIATGFAISAAAAPLVATQLYGVRLLDAPTMAGVPALLLTIAAMACYLPARRATAIDPVDALRN